MAFSIMFLAFVYIGYKQIENGKFLKGILVSIIGLIFLVLNFIPISIWYEAPVSRTKYSVSPICNVADIPHYCIYDKKSDEYTFYNSVTEERLTYPKTSINIVEISEDDVPYVQTKIRSPRWFASKLLCFANVGEITEIKLAIPKDSILYT